MNEPHRPFHCGTQFADWEDANCCRCKKYTPPDEGMPTCQIAHAFIEAMFGDGSVSTDIAERCGYLDNSPPRQDGFSYCWRCKEFQERPEPPTPGLQEPSPLKPARGQKELFA